MPRLEKQGVTLIEMLVIIILIGILASVGIVNYSKTKEHALGKEAQANLKLIAAAEKIYRLETSSYYVDPTDITEINSVLKLALPVSNGNWTYDISGTETTFTATAARGGSIGPYSGCNYTITEGVSEPSPTSGTCP
ncbi:MAG: prepilin-type N-terminal cleavage/methylation domain-containing protein [Candidatus Omnitrophica bacterium]|jgi:prepilin-type N-terminal cleavage/methylation domain-containing protein|nr:prepilin-type N-terminal cleavage/methylation domain-containing protein [Candidatus Omnitrophota bacterium]